MEVLMRPAVLAPVVVLVTYTIYQLFFKASTLPKKLPIIGYRKGQWLPMMRARWRNAANFKETILEAEREFPDQAVVLPIAGGGDMVLLPRSEIQFVVDQPDSVLCMHTQVLESLQADYVFADPSLVHNPLHHKLVSTTLTSQIGNLVPDVAEETAFSFAKEWGTDTEWKELCLYETMCRVIGSVTNRVFVGKPSCRDPELLRLGMKYAKFVPTTAQLLRLIPKPLRTLAGPLASIPAHICTRQFEAVLRPEIQRRLADYDARQRDPEDKSIAPGPNDFLQWSIHQAKETGDPYMWTTATLAGRVLLLNFAAIHTSAFSITSAILDLVFSKQEYVDELRAEIEHVLAEHGGEWNKRALAKMVKLDSIMRESSRLNSFVTVGLARRVVAPGGITTPSGVEIPQGATVVVPSYTVMQDEGVYPDPHEFKPFRFAEQRSDESVEYVKRAAKSFATTSTDFLAFGHGRNACPGRFFAANELKLMLAHMVLSYDLEIKGPGGRPRNTWFGLIRVPPMAANIRIKRRAT
ncbi:cytochrome P450 [Schizothecium vesticola]|uniref:Cytochrome P450 n=1 Tax=Schizothecium vesticola TaxID=314040 RepID=A0AA40EL69_9PEZI|nr:cytochrome P450 [Schizothecium vesticola]